MYPIPHIAEPSLAPGYDLTNGAASGGLPGEGAKNKRKQTLLSLLDALQELSKDGELDFSSACLTVIRRVILSNTFL